MTYTTETLLSALMLAAFMTPTWLSIWLLKRRMDRQFDFVERLLKGLNQMKEDLEKLKSKQ